MTLPLRPQAVEGDVTFAVRRPDPAETVPARAPDELLLGEAEERSLVDRAHAGDRRAFDALVRAHQRAIFSFAWRRTQNVEDARELSQQVFVRAFERLAGFRGEARLRTWLLSIAVHLIADLQRGRARLQPLTENTMGSVPPADELEATQASSKLRAAVARLPEKQRACVELRAFEELSFREVGEVLGINEDAAKMNFHLALKRLRQEMEQGR